MVEKEPTLTPSSYYTRQHHGGTRWYPVPPGATVVVTSGVEMYKELGLGWTNVDDADDDDAVVVVVVEDNAWADTEDGGFGTDENIRRGQRHAVEGRFMTWE